MRKASSVLEVDTEEMKVVSFVGKQLCVMLTAPVYVPILIERASCATAQSDALLAAAEYKEQVPRDG